MNYREYVDQFKKMEYYDDENFPNMTYEDFIFYFDEDRKYKNIFNDIFVFCRDNINYKIWNSFKILPCYFYFEKWDYFNAVAVRYTSNESIIAVNRGLVVKLNDMFTNLENHLDTLPESVLLKRLGFDTPVYFLMFQSCILFIYFHELGHIFQFTAATKKKLQERRMSNGSHLFDILAHAQEFDSDEFATNLTFNHLRQYWEKIPAGNRSREAFEAYVTVNIVALFILFDMLSDGISLPIYYSEYDHPHDVIRIVSVVGNFLEMAKGYPVTEDSGDEILKRAFQILQTILVENRSIDKFFSAIKSEKESIVAYSSMIAKEHNSYEWMVRKQMGK